MNPTPEELLRDYTLAARALDYQSVALAAVLLNYYIADAEKQRLFAALTGSPPPAAPDLHPLRVTASLMLLGTASYFWGVSDDAFRAGAPDPLTRETLEIDNFINASVTTAAAARLYSLCIARPGTQSPPAQTAPAVGDVNPTV